MYIYCIHARREFRYYQLIKLFHYSLREQTRSIVSASPAAIDRDARGEGLFAFTNVALRTYKSVLQIASFRIGSRVAPLRHRRQVFTTTFWAFCYARSEDAPFVKGFLLKIFKKKISKKN